jgi:IMP and pyridine-specific 5'-nucleotidase
MEAVTGLLDASERILNICQARLNLPAKVIRKERAVGIVPLNMSNQKLTREQLDECVLSLQRGLNVYLRRLPSKTPQNAPLPYCAFNGGNDVWVDIGNKLIGVNILQAYLGVSPSATLHVGDQFLSTGNDFAARRGCTTLWITNPEETAEILVELIACMQCEGRSMDS